MDSFTLAEFAKNSENKEDASFTQQVQEAGIEQGALIVSRLYNTMLGEITKTMKSWNAELTKVLEEGGITPSELTNEQLYTALIKIINRTHGRNIGDVYYSQSGSATDNPGALPLFTGELISNASNAFPEFCTWLSAHPSLCITQTQYDNRISQYGECPFYVYNVGSNTIRLPKLVNYVKMANSTDKINQENAGLPNITGTARIGGVGSSPIYINPVGGALYTTQSTNYMTRGENSGPGPTGLGFDASRSSSVYGRSNTVTPSHTTLFPWVTVYNVARPASEAQAAEFIGSLSGKADNDLNNIENVTATARHTITTWGVPDYSAIITGISFPYTAPCNGLLSFVTNGYDAQITINNNQLPLHGDDPSNEGPVQIILNKNDVVSYTSSSNDYFSLVFIPLKGE